MQAVYIGSSQTTAEYRMLLYAPRAHIIMEMQTYCNERPRRIVNSVGGWLESLATAALAFIYL